MHRLLTDIRDASVSERIHRDVDKGGGEKCNRTPPGGDFCVEIPKKEGENWQKW